MPDAVCTLAFMTGNFGSDEGRSLGVRKGSWFVDRGGTLLVSAGNFVVQAERDPDMTAGSSALI